MLGEDASTPAGRGHVKVLIVGLNYAPEIIGVGHYTHEFATWLAGCGHHVKVVTGHPYYPSWRIMPGYDNRRFGREIRDGLEVLRCPLWIPKRPTPGRRLLHLASFALSAFPRTLALALRWRPDVVWTVEPTLLGAPATLIAARLSGAAVCLHVQDLELEAALRLGMLRRPGLARAARAAYRWLLRRFDRVTTLSRPMHARLVAAGVAEERLGLFPNWVDTARIRPLDRPSRLRATLGIRRHRLVALYAGTMGTKQGFGCLIEAAQRLAGQSDVHFVLCGAGPVRREALARLHDQQNVTFLPLQPPAELNELLNLADIHLLPQRDGTSHFALPSKLGPMLASGRPIIAQCDAHCAVRDVVARCGLVVAPEDPDALAMAVMELAGDALRRDRLGRAAREEAIAHFERDLVIARQERQLVALATRPGRRAAEADGRQWAG